MADEQRKFPARLADFGSQYNQQIFLIKQIIKQSVCTAIPVRVDSIERPADGSGAGTLSATPLVAQTDADGNLIAPVSIPRLPWFRLQHGKAAVICDPVPGDVGLAVFAQSDCSKVNGGTEPVTPGSFRYFDMSDGFYIGGFFGKTPDTFIHLEQSDKVRIVAPTKVEVVSKEVDITASEKAVIKAPRIELDGAIYGGGSAGLDATFTGDVTAKGTSLHTHTHKNCEPGSGSSGEPN